MGSPEDRVMRGETWSEFCDALKRAGDVILRDGSPSDPFDRAEGQRYLSRLQPSPQQPHLVVCGGFVITAPVMPFLQDIGDLILPGIVGRLVGRRRRGWAGVCRLVLGVEASEVVLVIFACLGNSSSTSNGV